jgi:hypothetical protein
MGCERGPKGEAERQKGRRRGLAGSQPVVAVLGLLPPDWQRKLRQTSERDCSKNYKVCVFLFWLNRFVFLGLFDFSV